MLSADLNCGAVDGVTLDVEGAVRLPRTWERINLPLEDFAQPSWQEQRVDVQACLQQVDGLAFNVFDGITDGKSGNGTLLVDDVYLQ
jgi:hypothetical protein